MNRQDVGVSWRRYEGRALADIGLSGDARDAALEDHIRVQNPHLTDIRLERATASEDCEVRTHPAQRWYGVTYLADDGQGH